MEKGQIILKLQSYDILLLHNALKEIMEELKRKKISYKGPVTLPNRGITVTLKKSTHIYKEANERYQQTTHKVLICILSNSPEVIDSLSKINLVSSVSINIEI